MDRDPQAPADFREPPPPKGSIGQSALIQSSIAPTLWMVTGAFFLATMGAMSHALKGTCDWRLLALARAGIMLLIAVGLAAAAGVRIPVWRPVTLWVRSVAGAVGVVSTFYALTHMPVADAITLINMYPIWVALLTWPVLGERPSLRVWAAVLVSFGGVALIARPHFEKGSLAALAAVGSSLFTAVAVLGLHKLSHIDPRAVVAHFAGVATLSAGLFVFGSEAAGSFGVVARGDVALRLLGVGLTGTIGQIGLARAFALGNPPRVAVTGLTQLLFAVLYDLVLFERRFDPVTVAGMALVAAPTAWVLVRGRIVGG